MSTSKKNILQLTGVRGLIAFLIAYIWHYYLILGVIPFQGNPVTKHLFDSLGSLYFYIPDVFFVISGYLIQKSYSTRIMEQNLSFVGFMIPRVKKIYPIMIATTCITWLLQRYGFYMFGYYPLHADGGEIRNSILSFILSLFCMQSGYISDNDVMAINGPTWFVAVLILCYAIFYMINRYIKTERVKRVIYVLFIFIGIFILEKQPHFPLMYTVNARGYIGFFMGALMSDYNYKYIQNNRYEPECQKKKAFLSYIVVLIIFSITVFLQQTQDLTFNTSVVCAIIWPLFVYLVIHGYLMSRLFSLKPFVLLGQISMPIFLCNFPTDLLIKICDLYFKWELDYTSELVWLVHVLISLIIAVVFHFLFEVSWKKNFPRKKKNLVTNDVC